MRKLRPQVLTAGVMVLITAKLLAVPIPAPHIPPSQQPGAVPKTNSPMLTNLVFDYEIKQYEAKTTDSSASFIFNVTNRWTNELTIDRVQTSCGCTVASLPANPWHIPSGGGGEVKATLDLLGKPSGLITKTVTLYISVNGEAAGTRVLTIKAVVPTARPQAPGPLSEADRQAAMAEAKADPQQIFKDPKCAECHVNQGLHQLGEALYTADCGICHDSPNRAASVPDLNKMKFPAGSEYWKHIIAGGKPNTMMPAFATRNGGPLSQEQVSSLAAYLSRKYALAAGH